MGGGPLLMLRARCLHAFAGPLNDEAAFKLGQCAENVKDEFAAGGRGVDFFGERAEVNPAFVEVFNHGDEVAQAASRAVEFRDGERAPSFRVLRQRVRAGRLVVTPVRRSVKSFLHLARYAAALRGSLLPPASASHPPARPRSATSG